MIQYLRMRILSGYQSFRELKGLPHLDKDPIHHRNRPQEPHVLEVSKKIEWEDGPMAQAATRLQL